MAGGRERRSDLIPRLRQIAMILVFDLGCPLRSAGMSTVAALVISGVLPALGIVIGAVADRRLHVIGVVVLRQAGEKRPNAWPAPTPGHDRLPL